MPTIILAIESSCDETSADVIVDGKVSSNIVATQEIHAKYGGVVPELASRSHQKNIVPVGQNCLSIWLPEQDDRRQRLYPDWLQLRLRR